MGARVSAITILSRTPDGRSPRRTPSGHGSAEQRATGRAELLTSFSCHMCIQYSTQELQDVSLYKTSSDIIEPVELGGGEIISLFCNPQR